MESTSELSGCLFSGNTGGCVRLSDTTSRATVSNCVFTDNRGAIYGGQVACERCTFERDVRDSTGTTVFVDEGSFVDCLFRSNSARYVLNAGFVELNRCTFARNRIAGAFIIGCNEAQIRQCLFAGNLSNESICVFRVRIGATIANCTFVGNRAATLSIIDTWYMQEPVIITNCIFRDNVCTDTSWPMTVGNSPMVVQYSDVSDLTDLSAIWITAVANIDADPLFVDPGYWDPNGTADDPNDDFFVEGDYHLKSQAGRWDPNSDSWVRDDVTSPCIDAGDPNSPIGDEPFPNGGVVNMGAYGGTTEASKSYFSEPISDTIIAGDINGDEQGANQDKMQIAEKNERGAKGRM